MLLGSRHDRVSIHVKLSKAAQPLSARAFSRPFATCDQWRLPSSLCDNDSKLRLLQNYHASTALLSLFFVRFLAFRGDVRLEGPVAIVAGRVWRIEKVM